MTIQTVSPQMLQEWLANDEAVLVDVRADAEFKHEHIQGAIHLPLNQCNADTLPKYADKKLVFQCKLGKRSESACQQCKDAVGEENIWSLIGGIEAWKAAGLPIQSS